LQVPLLPANRTMRPGPAILAPRFIGQPSEAAQLGVRQGEVAPIGGRAQLLAPVPHRQAGLYGAFLPSADDGAPHPVRVG
jgi:hypothetical protein